MSTLSADQAASQASGPHREPPSPRAATTLVSSLQLAGSAQPAHRIPQLWRANEWVHAGLHPDCMPSGFEALDRELPGQGWPQGQLVELLTDHPGTGELSLLLPVLAAASRTGATCVWVLPCQQGNAGQSPDSGATPQALPYAPALQEAGIDLARSIFVRPLTPRESAWALEESLRAAHLGAVLGWLPEGNSSDADFRCLRRLHLLAQRHRALVFILRAAHHAQSPSPATLRLQLQHDGGRLQVRLLKRRGRPLLEPVCLQLHPARWNPAPAGVPARAASAASAPGGPSLLQRVRSLAPSHAWGMQAIPEH
jgi:hypothetical protein